MHEQYLTHRDGDLFGLGVCSGCGKHGFHPACEARVVELVEKFAETDRMLLRQHAVHKAYGIAQPASQVSFDLAVEALERYFGRTLEYDLNRVIEGGTWWFIPDGWIGVVGFIVEKWTGTLFALGSGFRPAAGTYAYVYWCGILAYLDGKIEAVEQ